MDPVDQVNVEFAHVHREFANAVDQRRVDARPVAGTVIAKGNLLCLLGEIEGRYGVLTHGLLILLVKFRIFVLYDFAQAELGQFLGNKLLIEQSALDGRLVLPDTRDYLVQILATNTPALGRFWIMLE